MNIFRARYLLPIGAPPLEDGALLVDGSRIIAVGPWRELAAAHPRATAVVYEDAVLLPPLVNAHTHLELTDFPDWAEFSGLPLPADDFVDWVMHLVQTRRNIGDLAVKASLCSGIHRSFAAGTGAVGDVLTTLPAVSAYAGTPMRGRVFAEVLGVDPAKVANRLTEIDSRQRHRPAPSLSWGLSPHAPYTLSPDTLELVSAFAGAHALPLAMHWAETTAEVDFLTRGCGPVAERLYPMAGWPVPSTLATPCSAACLPAGSLLIHGVHAGAEEVAAVAAAGLGVVLCPRSNSRFGASRAPLAAYRRAGVPLALGTDSLASSPSLSVWEELAFARSWFAGVLDPATWLEIATRGGAAALGLSGGMGRLVPGGEASFQVVGVPAGAGATNIEEALCAGGGGISVRALYLAGEQVHHGPMRPSNQ